MFDGGVGVGVGVGVGERAVMIASVSSVLVLVARVVDDSGMTVDSTQNAER